jgi:HlyD family secretion protein
MAGLHLRWRRTITWTMAAVVVGLLAVVVFRGSPVPADIVEVARGHLQVTIDREGRTRVRDRYVVSAPVAGRVLRIPLQPGDPVIGGQTLVATFLPELPPLLDARTRAEADARMRAAEADLRQAKAAQAGSEARLGLARKQRDRVAELLREALAPPSDLDAAEAEARAQAEAATAAAEGARAAQHQLDAARASLIATADSGGRAGRSLAIRAPVDGVVLERLHESESVVSAGEPLVTIANPADLEIIADYLSTEAVQIRPGMPAAIDRWGGDQLLRGHVRRVEPFAFLKVSALGVEEQRVNVVLGLDDPPGVWRSLGDGYRVEVRVVLWDRPDVLKVPTSALFRRGNDWTVFVVQGGRVRLRAVAIGQRTGLEAQVLGGLDEHDLVIVHPSDAVTDGVRVVRRT